MKDATGNVLTGEPAADLMDIALTIDGKEEAPTREEFFTNYPFFKYWNKDNNEKLTSPAGINLYIHIPFCIQICDYCFYMKELVKSKDQVDEYVDYLCREIALASETFNLGGREVNSIYMGGGTPSVLTEPQFKKLIDTLHKYHRIGTPEFTFEAEPGTFNRNKLGWYKDWGINRISMGVQSFDDRIIKMSSRKHSAAQAVNSIAMVQETGNFVVNIDLLSGLAGEEMESWEKSVSTALAQQVDMLTIYKMKAYANTVFYRKGVHKQEIELPSAAQETEFMKRALEMVEGAGYGRWSTFAFTRNGHLHRYAENTWRGQDLVAYGVSSFGKMGNINYQNSNTTHIYYDKINKGQVPVFRTYGLSHKEQAVKELLLCPARLTSYRKSEFVRKFGFDYFALIPGTIRQLTEKGYITPDPAELTLTQQGILFGDYVGKVLAASLKNVLGPDAIGFTYQE